MSQKGKQPNSKKPTIKGGHRVCGMCQAITRMGKDCEYCGRPEGDK